MIETSMDMFCDIQNFTSKTPAMTIGFFRPTGAAADVKELEYVSALHQTDLRGGLRKDGSITGEKKERKVKDTGVVL